MRISCEYKTKEIPIGYQMMVVSLVKEALKRANTDYFEKLYCYGEDKKNKKTKDFCSSLYMKGFERAEDVFIIKDRIIINFSSPNYEFMVNLCNGLMQIEQFNYKNFDINKVRIQMVQEKKVSRSRAIFKTLSPIHIKDKSNNALGIYDENFEKELNYIANISLENFRGFGLTEPIAFSPSNRMKKVVVKQEIKRFEEETGKRYSYIDCYAGEFQLEGYPKDLDDLYKLGIGFKRNQGFGMLDIIG